MKALQLFSKYAPNKTFIAILLGSLSGLLYAMLIPIVMVSLSNDANFLQGDESITTFLGFEISNSKYALLFLIICILILIFRTLSEVILARIALDIRFGIRKELYSKIENSPVASLESVGPSRLIQSLTTDILAIVGGAQLFPSLVTNVVTLLGMLTYLAYINEHVFMLIIQVIFFGVLSYQIPIYFGTKFFIRAREHQDILQEAFKGVVEGSKELKLSKQKQKVYKQSILYKQEILVTELQKKGITIYAAARNYGDLLAFFAIGMLSFILINYYPISSTETIAAVMVLLYVTGPISMLLNFIPQLARTNISLRKIDQLYKELPDEGVADSVDNAPEWSSLHFKNVIYKYNQEKANDNPFQIGPINLEISRGQITFVTGGNGSGKSTLAKLISHHYLPDSGEILFSNTVVNKNNLSSIREEISCIYSSYYLFDRILIAKELSADYEEKARHYLKAFGIDDKVTIKDGKFSTLNLSDGQRRRIALVVSIIEDKPLLIFDEWAADQDPQFKDIFYKEILKDLKQKNKAVVVISHDDRYFNVADKILVMESGKLIETIT